MTTTSKAIFFLSPFFLLPLAHSFQIPKVVTRSQSECNRHVTTSSEWIRHMKTQETDAEKDSDSTTPNTRRSFLSTATATSAGFLSTMLAYPSPNAFAGIDVSSLKKDSSGPNTAIAEQLKSYDGSGSRRIQEIQSMQSSTPTATTISKPPPPPKVDTGSAATYAYRTGGLPTLQKLGIGLNNRYAGYISGPEGSTKNKRIAISFDFPSDWLQLDKIAGGITYVDQRNGDKLYILRAPLPEGTTLASVPKTFFGESIFDPRGDIVRSGTVVDSYRVSRSQILSDCPDGGCATHRRLLLKYETVTGSGVQTVERRGLVDAYEVEGDVYMLMTSSNAVKFEAKGKERETVEAIVDSFRLEI